MGGSSSKTTQQTATNQGPWLPQQGYLTGAFGDAQNLYNQTSQNGYTGNFVAQPTAGQTNTFNSLLQGTGGTLDQSQASNAYGSAAAGSGLGATNGATSGLFGIAGQDPTQNNINAAGQYANNPYMDGMVNSALTDAQRQLTESTLPSIDRDAAATGNLNSSRAGVASGIAQRGFQETAANTSANLRGQAYQSGISQAQQDTANQIGALSSAGQLGNSQFGQGLYGIGNSSNILNTGVNAATGASAGVTANNQAPLDNALAQSQYSQNNPWQMLQNYYGIVGGNNWGQNGTSSSVGTQQQNPSMLSSIGSVAGILGSLFKCDIRTKENIEQIGRTADGFFPLYMFTYKDAPQPTQWHVAPMAQDVEKVFPDAILEIDGIKHIDTHVYDWRT